MTPNTIAVRMIPALLAVLAIAGGLRAAETPFNGKLEGTVIVTPTAPPEFDVDIDAEGTATHLGKFFVTIPHAINRALGIGVGTYNFTAANGDTLTATFEGRSQMPIPGVVLIVEAATINGGTGRFANATGQFTVVRTYLPASSVTFGTFEGVILTPAR